MRDGRDLYLSIGIEHIGDIIGDLDQALGAVYHRTFRDRHVAALLAMTATMSLRERR